MWIQERPTPARLQKSGAPHPRRKVDSSTRAGTTAEGICRTCATKVIGSSKPTQGASSQEGYAAENAPPRKITPTALPWTSPRPPHFCPFHARPKPMMKTKSAAPSNPARAAQNKTAHFTPTNAIFAKPFTILTHGIPFVYRNPVAVVVTVMSGQASHSHSWSAVGSHGQCRPAGGRPDDTLARGFFIDIGLPPITAPASPVHSPHHLSFIPPRSRLWTTFRLKAHQYLFGSSPTLRGKGVGMGGCGRDSGSFRRMGLLWFAPSLPLCIRL